MMIIFVVVNSILGKEDEQMMMDSLEGSKKDRSFDIWNMKREKEEKMFEPRPVMVPTSWNEITLWKHLFQIGKQLPVLDWNLPHATRYWVAMEILREDKIGRFSRSSLARHMSLNPELLEKRKLDKYVNPKGYDFLSPGEKFPKRRVKVINSYGRAEDKQAYFERKEIYRKWVKMFDDK